ncbi:MAG TPA: hypothetical protein ENI37_01080 [Chloroflexi bacterium]|nr:hypothetical protein [Chloroflexota bacterium]
MNEKHERGKWWMAAGAALLLATMACNLPGGGSPTAIPATAEGVGEVTTVPPSVEETVPPTEETPVPDVTTEAGCTLNGAYVADVTIPDGTEFPPGASFIKTWRVRNTGTCPWEPGTSLVFISGDPLGGPGSVSVGPVAPGSTTDVSVNLVAPAAPGTYKGNWQLQAPDGTRFGSIIYVQIVVPVPITDTPTPTETTTPTTTPTTSPCVDPDPALEPILDHAESLGYDMGCPTAPAFSVYGAFQEFWANVDNPNPHFHYRSLMIWRSDNKEIYVIDGQDTDASSGMLLAYTDTWEEGQPEVHPDCAGMTPPAGYELPIRGFGKVWCVNELVDEVGWPSEHEAAVTLLIQPMQTGLLLKVFGPIPIGYLIALDYQAVWAVTMMTAP